MATKLELLQQAGRQLGDTSSEFITNILAPSFDYVLADLAAYEAIDALKKSTTFPLVLDRREYETRECCRLTPHYPGTVTSLRVWDWGPLDGAPKQATDDQFDRDRLRDGETKRGKFYIWRLYPNHRTLQIHPPAGSDEDGVEVEITFEAPWASIELTQDVLDIQQEDIECLALGLQVKGAAFSELLAQDRVVLEQKYEMAKRRMWARRWVHGQHLARRR